MNSRIRISRLPRILAAVSLVATLSSAAIAQESLPQIFDTAKQQFREGKYRESLASFDRLDELSRRPGFESDRSKLEGVILFYRAANLASLGQKNKAVEAFRAYLAFAPAATLDPAVYSKKVIQAFDDARREEARENARKPADLATVYSRFALPPERRIVANEKWAESPVRYLMTPEERAEWAALSTTSERERFVDRFWKRRDPTPATPVNEFREEIDRRILFSEEAFGERESDRALVFTLLGPPTYVSVARLSGENNPIEAMRGAVQGGNLGSGHQTVYPTRTLEQDFEQGSRELWMYRKDRLPPAVPFQEVQFEFLSKKGYGDRILQREPKILSTLDQAANAENETLKAN